MRYQAVVFALALGCVAAPVEGDPPSVGASSLVVADQPVIPPVDGAVRAHVLQIMGSTAGLANSRDLFAKVGDSITESGSYLKDNGCSLPPSASEYDAYGSLMPVTTYFTNHTLPVGYSDAWCGLRNAFTRASHVAMSGMTSSFAMSTTTLCAAPNNTRLRCEYELMRPSFALIMFGTNDVLANVNVPLSDALTTYRTNMQRIIDESISMGVVPVLSTIPPLIVSAGNVTQAQADRVGAYNQVVVDLTELNTVPLWNYFRAMNDLGAAANYGVSSDGIHPSIYRSSLAGIFTPVALGFGYNVRNLGAIQVLAALKSSVLDATSAPSWNTTSLPAATVGVAYSTTVSASGNPAPTYGATGLPAGLTINTTSGAITGTPTASGTFSVVLTASNGTAPDATRTLSLTVNPAVVTVAPSITTTSLPAATAGVAYSTTVSATGTPAPTFGATGLPAGLTINTTSGAITGTPTASGTFSVVVTASNGTLPDASRTLSLTVNPAVVTVAPSITTTSLPSGVVNVAYSATVSATGTPAPTFGATGLPAGLTINTTSGAITGTPTASGTFSVVVTASNGTLPNASRTLSLTIAVGIAPRITSGTPPSGTRNVAYSFTVTASGTPAPTFSVDVLPSGLTLNAATGVISGTPTRVETVKSRITASNGVSPAVTVRYSIAIR